MKNLSAICWAVYSAAGQERFYPLDLLRKKARVLITIGEWDRAEAIYRSNIGLAREHLPSHELAEELYSLSRLLSFRSCYGPAMELAEEAYEIFQGIGSLEGRIKAWGLIGEIYNYWGDYHRALEYLSRMREMAKEAGLWELWADSLKKMGICYYWLGDNDKTLELLEESLRISEEAGNTYFRAGVIHAIGLALREKGDYEKSQISLQESLRLFRIIGDQRSIAMALGSLAGLYLYQKEHDRALELFSRQVEIAEKLGDRYFLACAFGDIASVYLCQGRLSRAEEYSIKEKTLAQETGDATILADSYFRQGVIKEYQGEDDEAGEFYDHALEQARRIRSQRFLPQYIYSKALWEYRQGHYQKAEELLSEIETPAGPDREDPWAWKIRMLQLLIHYPLEPEASESELLSLAKSHSQPSEDLGMLLYHLWGRSHQEEHRLSALEVFQELLKEMDCSLYRSIIGKLQPENFSL